MSTVEFDTVHIKGSVGFKRLGAETPLAIPGDGILVLHEDEGSAITLASGTLRGIRFLDADENPVVLDNGDARAKKVRAATGSTVTVVFNDTINVTEPTERIVTSSQQNVVVTNTHTDFYFAYVAAIGAFRWFAQDNDQLAVDDAADWSPTPTRITDAIDQLATRAPLVIEDSAAFTSGNALDLWTYTLAEGEAVGIQFQLTGATLTGGVTVDRSLGRIAVVGSRDVGGSAAVTVGTNPDEVGTITGGVMSAAAVGNDVVISVTYTANGTLYYKLRIERDSITPV